MKPVEDYSDKELYEELSTANAIESLLGSEGFGKLKEAAKRIEEKAIKEFLTCDPSDMVHIAQLQIIIKKYRYNLFSEINALKSESESLYEEAKDRGIVGR